MPTCFLFAKYLDDSGCLCLRVDDHGIVDAPPEQRDFDAIKVLQANARTIIIETTEQASILEGELPLIGEKKTRTAIPYALEDELAQSVNQVHFAFDRQFYANQRYLVVAMDKEKMKSLMDQLQRRNINFEAITLDWFALKNNEIALIEDALLVHRPDFKGALSRELAQMYFKKSEKGVAYSFGHSETLPLPLEYEQVKEDAFSWIAKRLMEAPWINLCQGEMQQQDQSRHLKKGYQIAAVLAAVWLASMIGTGLIKNYSLNKRISAIDQEIALIYKNFFPEARQVISPKFRISQLLADNGASRASLWRLLAKLSQAMQSSTASIDRLTYQNNVLSITITSSNFAELEQLENQLQQMQLHVNQTQAATQEDKVVATLELT